MATAVGLRRDSLVCLLPAHWRVGALVGHGGSWRGIQAAGVFHRFWYTDSCPTTAASLKGQEPFRLVSLAPHLATLLLSDLAH